MGWKEGSVGHQWNSWSRGGKAVAHHTGSLLNTGSSHRWRNGNDKNGLTMCMRTNDRAVTKWKGHEFVKVRVSGPMDKNHILKACKSNGMVPVCDHHAYRDGVCYDSGVNLHFSHQSHDRHAKLNFPVVKAKGVFWYTGRHHTGSLYNTGGTHRWRNGNDKNGLTMCTPKRLHSGPSWVRGLSKGRYGGHDLGAGRFNQLFQRSKTHIIMRKCADCHQDYKTMYYRRYTRKTNFPVYDYMKQNWKSHHNVINRDFGIFSSYSDALHKRNPWKFCNYNGPGIGFPRDCGKRGGVGHQWNSWSRGGKAVAYYIDAGAGGGPTWVWKHKKFYKVRVSGPMDKNHILKACQSKGLKPVCDHHAYRDGHCFDSKVNLHFSHPHHDKNAKLGFPVAKAKGVFWSTGRHHTGSLYNTGSTHRWRNGHDKNGWTMCA